MIELLLGMWIAVMGAGISMQPLLNAHVASRAGHPIYGALISVFVSTCLMLVLVVAGRLPAPSFRDLAAGPAWMWIGGVIGALYVLAALIATPRLGAATTVAIFIAGQLVASIVIDHYGLLGVPVHSIGIARLLGVAMLAGGVALIRFT
ncbi:MAG TPA: DMT family transporter [Geminicoccus sp.]|uniref:DMT family transporter n=1 Tax=Geminicoccus sp. TaxID=2024832 RepID=UPI002E31C246|nr:DMT family transporter [Geminicoccus sp.]HEX2529295.1 DMT family transporter [Geminicoccus sp.]